MATALERKIQGLVGYQASRWLAPASMDNNFQQQVDAQSELRAKTKASAKARSGVDATTRNSARAQASAISRAAGVSKYGYGVAQGKYEEDGAKSQAETAAARDRAKEALNPWRQAGVDALGQIQEKIAAGPGDFEESPGYQWRLKEGQKEVERGASARGGALSGQAVKESLRYGQGFASNEYDKFIDRYYKSFSPLQNLSQGGYNASTQQGNIDTQSARDLADQSYRSTTGAAQAAIGGANAEAGGITGAAGVTAANEKETAERRYGYAAFKAGEDF